MKALAQLAASGLQVKRAVKRLLLERALAVWKLVLGTRWRQTTESGLSLGVLPEGNSPGFVI